MTLMFLFFFFFFWKEHHTIITLLYFFSLNKKWIPNQTLFIAKFAFLFDSRFQIRFPLFLDSVSMIPYFRAAHMEDWESFWGQNHFGAVTIITANVRLFLVLVDWVFYNVIIFACCVVVLVLRDLNLMLGILVIAFCSFTQRSALNH